MTQGKATRERIYGKQPEGKPFVKKVAPPEEEKKVTVVEAKPPKKPEKKVVVETAKGDTGGEQS